MINWFNKKNQLSEVKFKDRMMHQSWCLKNDITMIIIEQQWNKCFIRINDKGNIVDDPNYYKQSKLKVNDKQIGKKVFELYTEYYNKYNKDE